MFMNNYDNSHNINNLQTHLVWIIKYRYQVLQNNIQLHYCDILRQSI